MNITNQQMLEVPEIVCQIHKHEIIAIDLVSPENKQFQQLCCDCLVEKMNNNNISTMKQIQERIQTYKSQRQEKKTKDIQNLLNNYQILLDQIQNLKHNFDNSLEKIYSEIKTQKLAIQKEIQSQQENCQTQLNFFEEVRQLSQFLQNSENLFESYYHSQFINESFRQFQLIFSNETYNKTMNTFKDVIQDINNLNKENNIEIMSLQLKNNQKTQSLSTLCPTHNKEIIMIDIDSINKNIQDRFACAKCISDHPQCQYRTIEEVNQKWNKQMKEQNSFIIELKSKRQKKKEKLNFKIDRMRKDYNVQLDVISEMLRTGFSFQVNETREINKFKQDSIQQLNQEELFSNIQDLVKQDGEQLIQDSKIEFMITQEKQLSKNIENQLEQLKQYDQLNIQESINIVQDQPNGNQIQEIFLQLRHIQDSTIANQEQEQVIKIQELDEFISSSKYVYCSMELFNQTIKKYQDHLKKIDAIKNKMKSIQGYQNFTKIQKQLHDYIDKFEKDFIRLKKFCEIDNLEENLQSLKSNIYQRLVQLGLNIKPNLLQDYCWVKIFQILQSKARKSIENSVLIYQSTKDGLNSKQFWRKVDGKGNLLMVFKSKSDYIFGAYSPCIWKSGEQQFIEDNTLQSFIFSQTLDQVYPLKQDEKEYAIHCNSSDGPSFGQGHDIYIGSDFTDGYAQLGQSYQFDEDVMEDQNLDENRDGPQLFGQIKPEIIECEIYEIQFG